MAKKTADKPSSTGSSRAAVRYIFLAIGGLMVAILCVAAFNRVEHFLITDTRFHIPAPLDPGGKVTSPHFRIEGARYASEAQIAAVFQRDFGRSIYLCPLLERRRQLLAVSWVHEASVSRIWPNRLVVRVQERKPVAFVQFNSAAGTRWGLIDGEGVFLAPERNINIKLPVLTGMKLNDTMETRKERVGKLKRLQTELGTLMDRVSEVDVADTENIRVTTQMEGHGFLLYLGNMNLRQRMENFLNHYVSIRKNMPNAKVLDCRLPDRIIAVEEPSRVQ
jgi:cell division protein FtsQ